MPRLKGAIPAYRKHRQSGQAIVTLNGRDYLLGPHGTKTSKAEYDRLVAEWLLHDRQLQPGVSNDGLTVVELVAAYLHFARRFYRKDGQLTSEYCAITSALRPMKLLYGRKPCSEFGPIALQVVMQRFVDDGLARSTINQHASRIKRMFRWGVSRELIPAAVAQSLWSVNGLRKGRSEARETDPVLPVDDATMEATLKHLPEVVADMVRFQRFVGLRPSELCNLRPMDLDRSCEVWTYRPESHKTEHHGKLRVACIGPQAQQLLLRYLARDTAMYCFRPMDSEAKRRTARHSARVVPLSCGTKPGDRRQRKPRRAGDRYTVASYRRAINRACDNAKIERWSPNRLRHAAATEIRRRFGLEAAQTVLGHSKADVTQVYAERDYALAARVAKEVG